MEPGSPDELLKLDRFVSLDGTSFCALCSPSVHVAKKESTIENGTFISQHHVTSCDMVNKFAESVVIIRGAKCIVFMIFLQMGLFVLCYQHAFVMRGLG